MEWKALVGPHPVDVHVGRRVRRRRKEVGFNQQVLGDQLGLTFQQIQKYERGSNRISASKLYEIAHALSVPIGYFFEGADDTKSRPTKSYTALPTAIFEELAADPHGRALAEAFLSIRRRKLRSTLVDLVREIATSK